MITLDNIPGSIKEEILKERDKRVQDGKMKAFNYVWYSKKTGLYRFDSRDSKYTDTDIATIESDTNEDIVTDKEFVFSILHYSV